MAFQQLKEYLSWPPIMFSPEVDKVLFAYIAMAPHAVTLVLIRVDNSVQRLVYFVSKSLHEAKIRYLPLEKAILAVVHGTRKLPHYFQAHTVVILTQLPFKAILRNADYTGRIAKWGTVLGGFDIKYMPRISVKGQVLVDLVAEFVEPSLKEVTETQHMDGKLGLVLISPKKLTIEKLLRLGFSATNNEAEYEALLEGMSMVQRMGGKAVRMFSNSRLVVGQVKGKLEVKDERMQGYLSQVWHLELGFKSFSLLHVSRSGNTHVDSLAMLATSSMQSLPRVILIEDLCKPTGEKGKMVHVHQVRVGPS